MKREYKYIEYISRFFSGQKGLVLGPGDDCAVLKIGDKNIAVTVDEIIDNTHFKLDFSPPAFLASRLVRAAVSDIYAMGNCVPVTCLVSAGLSEDLDSRWFDSFIKYLKKECEYFGLTVAGGNIAKARELHLAMTVIGVFKKNRIIKRKGCAEGELLYAIGKMGGARAGLEILSGKNKKYSFQEKKLIKAFFKPHIFKEEVPIISVFATAMLDNSDGLYKSLGILSRENSVKLVCKINENFADTSLIDWCLKNNKDWKEYVLNGGEDYNLIFSIKASDKDKIEKKLPYIYQIGYIEKGKGVRIEDYNGKINPFEHF